MIYITGDTHREFTRLSGKHFQASINDYIIICGDFGGVWDNSNTEKYWLKWLSERSFTTLYVSGNHENFDLLSRYPVSLWNGGQVQFINEKVIHLMRGQIFTIDGHKFFTMGGASSHDINGGILEKDDPGFAEKRKKLDREMALYRINHISWWENEIPTQKEFDEGLRNLELHNWKVDYILTHCAPTSIQDVISRGFHKHDVLTDYLETILKRCTFQTWFLGHYHENKMIGDKFVLLYEEIYMLE